MIQSWILCFFNNTLSLERIVRVYPTAKTTTHVIKQKKSNNIGFIHEGWKTTYNSRNKILMSTYFFECTVSHVLRKLAFFYMFSFGKHYTFTDLKFQLN